MYKVFLLGVFVHLAMAGWGQAVIQEASEQDIPHAYAPGEIIVKFHKKAADALEDRLQEGKPPGQMRLSEGLDKLNARHRVKAIKPVFKNFKKNRQKAI